MLFFSIVYPIFFFALSSFFPSLVACHVVVRASVCSARHWWKDVASGAEATAEVVGSSVGGGGGDATLATEDNNAAVRETHKEFSRLS